MIMFLLNALLMNLLPSWRVDFPVQNLPDSFTYTTYDRSQPTVSKMIGANDADYLKLKTYLLHERHGWRYDVVSYVPHKLFSSPSMTINCMGRSMVVNYEVKPGTWTQMSKAALQDVCPSP